MPRQLGAIMPSCTPSCDPAPQGFTNMSAVTPPAAVFAMLNDLYARLDALTLHMPAVYKMETIGAIAAWPLHIHCLPQWGACLQAHVGCTCPVTSR